MSNIKTEHKLFAITMILLVGLCAIIISTPAFADRGKKTSPYSEYENKEIKGVELDGRGILARIDKEVCVIEDVLHPFARFVSYYSAQDGSVIYRSKFTAGTFVGYRINSKREIIELYLFGE
ncbi:MAG: hypothetical protein P8Y74_12430 [Desulfobacterales bacterium]